MVKTTLVILLSMVLSFSSQAEGAPPPGFKKDLSGVRYVCFVTFTLFAGRVGNIRFALILFVNRSGRCAHAPVGCHRHYGKRHAAIFILISAVRSSSNETGTPPAPGLKDLSNVRYVCFVRFSFIVLAGFVSPRIFFFSERRGRLLCA